MDWQKRTMEHADKQHARGHHREYTAGSRAHRKSSYVIDHRVLQQASDATALCDLHLSLLNCSGMRGEVRGYVRFQLEAHPLKSRTPQPSLPDPHDLSPTPRHFTFSALYIADSSACRAWSSFSSMFHFSWMYAACTQLETPNIVAFEIPISPFPPVLEGNQVSETLRLGAY